MSNKTEAEKSLKNSYEIYSKLIDNSNESVCVLDTFGKIVFANSVFFKIFGYDRNELDELLFEKIVHPIDRQKVIEKILGAVAGRKTNNRFDFRIISNNRETRLVNYTGSLIKVKGKILGIQVILRDITENSRLMEQIRQSKKHYLQVIDTIQDAICVIDDNFKIRSCNKVFAEKIKTPLKSVKGMKCCDVLPLFEKGLFKDYCIRKDCDRPCQPNSVFQTGKEVRFIEKNLDRDGETHYHRISEFPNLSSEGKVNQVVMIIRDVTDQISAEEELRRLSEFNKKMLEKKIIERTWQLDKANKDLAKVLSLQSKFISDASHELRTPLTIIQGNLDLAINEAKMESKEVPEVLEVLNKEVRQMSNILTDLSMITSADANSEILEYEIVDLAPLLLDVRNSLKVLAEKKKIKLVYKKNPKIKVKIRGDEIKLERLFLNIVRNAIKYTKEKGKIEIWAEKCKEKICVYVKDNGIGIPAADLPYIFNRFYRVDKARSRDEGGTGLGLSIGKLIAEAHGGKIFVASVLGKGSTFTVELPLDYKKGKFGNSSFIDLEDVHS